VMGLRGPSNLAGTAEGSAIGSGNLLPLGPGGLAQPGKGEGSGVSLSNPTLVLGPLTLATPPVARPDAPAGCPPTPSVVKENYGRLPVSFEANQGQTDSQVQFLARGSGYTLFLTGTEAVMALSPPTVPGTNEVGHGHARGMTGVASVGGTRGE